MNVMEKTQETDQEVDTETQDVGREVKLKESILKKFPKKDSKGTILLVAGSLLVVLAGVGSGWLLSVGAKGGGLESEVSGVAPGGQKSQVEAGISDEATFKDSAEGILEEGGIDGEGTYHLVREGGPTKYVYLTSTVIDLESFKGKTVKVWGETISAIRAGWLMDVGRIKVLE